MSLHTDAAGTAPPDAFGRFRVLHQIGAGALGPVFRAYDPDGDRLVAVKLFRLDLPPERVHQLVAELERLIAAELAHPSIVAPIETGIEGVTAYFVQEWVAADSLDVTLRHGETTAADALRVTTQLADALDYAAAKEIEHGALHPRDVLLFADEAKLTGLAVAQSLETIGVPAPVRRPYTAPERTDAPNGRRRGWDRRADVFGLAALAHEMLWGRRLTALGDEAAAALTGIAGGDLARLRHVFRRALAEEPAERFETSLDFALALASALPALAGRVPLPIAADLPAVETEPFLSLEAPDASLEVVSEERPEPAGDQLLGAANDESVEIPVDEPPDAAVDVPTADLRLRVAGPGRFEEVGPAPGTLFGPPTMAESPAAVSEERSPSAISPLAFALVIGVALGFAAGFGVGVWSRSVPGAVAVESAVEPAAAVTDGPREFTEAAVPTSNNAPEGPSTDRITPPPPAASVSRGEPPGLIGSLLVRSTPGNARVTVDGREYGRTPVTVGNLARGTHRVRVVRDGYLADERQVTITSAQRAQSVTVRLSRERSAPVTSVSNGGRENVANAITAATSGRGVGALVVESRPAGANVFVDGKLVGTTPLMLPEVPAGDHAIHLELQGYQRWASSVRIVPADRNRVAASLE